ncbi:MAG: leucine-rich repeat domain-containing protein, partial [Desulfamplus sp.]|nr:leucine-rich repeat domain-containing protein [Desulfamplus sp.]
MDNKQLIIMSKFFLPIWIKLKNVLGRILRPDDTWIQELRDWADENVIPDYGFYNITSIVSIPRKKDELLSFTTLNLSHSQLTELPESIGKLTQLTELRLNGNKLKKLPI